MLMESKKGSKTLTLCLVVMEEWLRKWVVVLICCSMNHNLVRGMRRTCCCRLMVCGCMSLPVASCGDGEGGT